MPRVTAATTFEFCPLCQEVDGDGNRRITWNATAKYGRCIHCGRPLLKPRIPNEWQPRPDQQGVWNYLYSGGKRAALVAHRRWGKDDIALNFTAVEMLRRVGNYWHMLPEAKQARKVVWDAVNPHTGVKRIDQAFPPWMRKSMKEQEMMIESVNGSTWQLVGSDNYSSLVGSPPVGIVFSEWAIANPLAWAYLAPILEENGGWALFIYTSRGMNHGKTIYDLARVTEGWYAELLSAEHTPVFTAEQLANIRRDYARLFGEEYGTLLFEQEYLCSFGGAILGAYFARQMVEAREEKRIGSIPWRRGIEVETFWDLGVDDSMSIWFMQVVGQSFNFIDYYEASGFGLEHYAKALRGELPGSEHRKKYTYGNYYMPHDASHREMTNNEIAMSRKEVAEALGMKPIIVVSRVKNVDILVHVHIPAVRNMLDRCYFDEVRCSQGISALEQFRSEYDEEKKKLGNRPLHDWTCLAGDTKIRTTHGWIPIKDLNGDEYVWGYSLKDHRLKPAQITFAGVTGVGRGLLNVTLDNGKSIKATPEHRWMMRDESYKRTDELVIGDSLMPFYENGNRSYMQIDHSVIRIEPVAESMLVYDITSPDLENFVAEGVVVHNSHASSAMITCAVGYKEQLPVKSVSSMLDANGPISSQWSGRR